MVTALEVGDRLMFVTDGMLERDAELVNISAILSASRSMHAREAVQLLTQEVLGASRGELRDDATVLCLDWEGGVPRDRDADSGANRYICCVVFAPPRRSGGLRAAVRAEGSGDLAEVFQLRECAQLLQGVFLDLPDALPRHAEDFAEVVQGCRRPSVESVAELEHASLSQAQGREGLSERA